ncbi:MAG: cryptochrome/photolyase family protein [Chthoniobacteraceae bacterium]
MRTVIHWFRRDLRLADNTALNAATASADAVVPVYVLSDWKRTHPWTGAPRQEFLCGSLAELAGSLKRAGGRLIIRQGRDQAGVLAKLIRETGAEAIYFNRDPDPHGRKVEAEVTAAAKKLGCSVHACKDVGLFERDEVRTRTGTPFKVYGAYARAWNALEKPASGPTVTKLTTPTAIKSLPLPTLATWDLKSTATIITPGEAAARKRLSQFLEKAISSYDRSRDLPAEEGTSRISQDLRFGLLSIREVYEACAQLRTKARGGARESIDRFIGELIWRDFYMQVLWHHPDVLDHEFLPAYRGMPWAPPGEAFERWRNGQTGFPIVDAGMRQLLATGFMHNRVRMITAMFLAKDLRLSWKLGEQAFMQLLVDGEIASNNGGWQWCASVGTDAQPYFRIQNPWTQTARHDPDGAYIHKWVPELRDVPARRLSRPPRQGERLAKGYPEPIVDHAEARLATLEAFQIQRTRKPTK